MCRFRFISRKDTSLHPSKNAQVFASKAFLNIRSEMLSALFCTDWWAYTYWAAKSTSKGHPSSLLTSQPYTVCGISSFPLPSDIAEQGWLPSMPNCLTTKNSFSNCKLDHLLLSSAFWDFCCALDMRLSVSTLTQFKILRIHTLYAVPQTNLTSLCTLWTIYFSSLLVK